MFRECHVPYTLLYCHLFTDFQFLVSVPYSSIGRILKNILSMNDLPQLKSGQCSKLLNQLNLKIKTGYNDTK